MKNMFLVGNKCLPLGWIMGPELSKTWYLGQNLKKFGFCWCNFEHLYFILFLNSYKASKLHDMFVVFHVWHGG